MRSKFVILANGILTSPKLARIDGMEKFQGESFHTSRWNYDVELEGKRIGIIGTGAARGAGHPRTGQDRRRAVRVPAHAVHHRDVRDQRATSEEEIETWRRTRAGPGPAAPASPS